MSQPVYFSSSTDHSVLPLLQHHLSWLLAWGCPQNFHSSGSGIVLCILRCCSFLRNSYLASVSGSASKGPCCQNNLASCERRRDPASMGCPLTSITRGAMPPVPNNQITLNFFLRFHLLMYIGLLPACVPMHSACAVPRKPKEGIRLWN